MYLLLLLSEIGYSSQNVFASRKHKPVGKQARNQVVWNHFWVGKVGVVPPLRYNSQCNALEIQTIDTTIFITSTAFYSKFKIPSSDMGHICNYDLSRAEFRLFSLNLETKMDILDNFGKELKLCKNTRIICKNKRLYYNSDTSFFSGGFLGRGTQH